MTAEEYRALLDVDFNNVKIEDLTDIRKIKIDKNQPQSKRQAQFLKSAFECLKICGGISK